MAFFKRMIGGLSGLFRKKRMEQELDEELRQYLETAVEHKMSAGLSREQALRQARLEMGSREAVKDGVRDAGWEARLETVGQDIRFAVRMLRRSPGFTAVAVVTLALGIGATTAIFSVVNAVLLQPLPFRDPERLVNIVEIVPAEENPSGAAIRRNSMNTDEFGWWRERTQTLDMAVTSPESRTLATPEGAVRLRGARVSPLLFTMRGLAPLLGRGLALDEERPDTSAVVLGAAAWRRHFGADPEIVGRSMTLDGRPYTIVGVMPPEFGDEDFWTPFVVEPPNPGAVTFIAVSARLRDGVSLEAATAEANVLGGQLRGIPPEPGAPPRFEIVRTQDQMTAPVRPALGVLAASVGVVLLIVCANVANLLLARGTRRRPELGLRRALGAGRGRIARQLLTESVVLATAGGLAGIVFAYGGVRLLQILTVIELPDRFRNALGQGGAVILPRIDEIAVDGAVLAFALGVSLAVGLLFGVWPALTLTSRRRAGAAREDDALRMAMVGGRNRAGRFLATAQLTLATALLVGAGLLIHSFIRLSAVDAGFDPARTLNFQLVLPGEYRPTEKFAIASELAERLESLPPVEAAGFTDAPPLAGGVLLGNFIPPGMTAEEITRGPMFEQPQSRRVSTGYLRALGARLVEGRWIEETDGPPQSPVVLVSRAYARRFFGEASPLGAVLTQPPGPRDRLPLTIVGVLDDLRFRGLASEPEAVVFLDPRYELARMPGDGSTPMADQVFLTAMTGAISFAVRVEGDPARIAPDVRTILQQIDRNAAIEGLAPMTEVISSIVSRPRFYAVLLSVFGAIAAALAAIGVYGVLAYAVSQRTREIGIRMALGADRRNVLGLILRQGLVMIAIGIPAGIAGAVVLTRSLESMLFGLSPLDPLTYAVVGIGFAAVALLASYVPARRATKVNPLAAIRCE